MRRLFAGLLMLAFFAATCPLFAQQDQQQQPAQKAAKKNAKTRFEEMDTNKDGKISREEWKGNPKEFDRLDANHDGSVTLEEMRAGRKPPNRGKKKPQ